MKKINLYILLGLLSSATYTSCTNLDEELNGTLTRAESEVIGSANDALSAAYLRLQDFQDSNTMFAVAQHPTEETVAPTRGGNWDDGGAWRQMHLMTWTPSNPRIVDTWNALLSGLFRATEVLAVSPSPSEQAQAQLLRSFYIFHATDVYGTVPIREAGEDIANPPSLTASRTQAIDIAIDELEAELANLPEFSSSSVASDMAGHALLAQMYLNRAVYKATDADGTPQAGPYTFDPADMNRVIELCDVVINSGNFSVEDEYFSSFSPENGETSSEIILASKNTNAFAGEMRRLTYLASFNGDMKPASGWNGFSVLSDFYDSFESGDVRRDTEVPYLRDNFGINAGFLIGPQVDKDGDPIINSSTGTQLVFEPEIDLFASADNAGIRVAKYFPDIANLDSPNNDLVLLRYADVWLMKAEALFRTGDVATALTMINTLRTARSASTLGALTEADILAERGRELYWEGYRRRDKIRFSTFLDPIQERPNPVDRTRLILPIPSEALGTNPILVQNPGY